MGTATENKYAKLGCKTQKKLSEECKILKKEIDSFKKKLDKLHKEKKELHAQKNKAHAALAKHLEKQGEKLADHVDHLDNKLKKIHASIKATKDALHETEKQYKELGCKDSNKGTDKETAECK